MYQVYGIFALACVKSALSCDGVKVSLNQNDIEEGHNRYRADVSKTKRKCGNCPPFEFKMYFYLS